MSTDRATITALLNIIGEVETLIATTTPLPENRTPRCLELLKAAQALAGDALRGEGRTH